MSRWGEMFAALSHQPDTVDTVDTVRIPPVIPLTVSHSVHYVTKAEREIEATAPDDAQQPAVVDCDELDERAAIIEYGAGVPRRWAEGFAALCAMSAPTGFAPERWQRIVDAVGFSSTVGPPKRSAAAGRISTCLASTRIVPTPGLTQWGSCCCSIAARSSASMSVGSI